MVFGRDLRSREFHYTYPTRETMAVPLSQDSIKLAAILQLIRNIPLLVQKQAPKVQQVTPVVPTRPAQPPKPKDVAVKKRKSLGSSATASTSTLKSPKQPKLPVKAPYKVTKKVAPSKPAKRKDSVVSLPLSRVRTVMKTAPEASTLSQESITVAAKAAVSVLSTLVTLRDVLVKALSSCVRRIVVFVGAVCSQIGPGGLP